MPRVGKVPFFLHGFLALSQSAFATSGHGAGCRGVKVGSVRVRGHRSQVPVREAENPLSPNGGWRGVGRRGVGQRGVGQRGVGQRGVGRRVRQATTRMRPRHWVSGGARPLPPRERRLLGCARTSSPCYAPRVAFYLILVVHNEMPASCFQSRRARHGVHGWVKTGRFGCSLCGA